MLVFFSAKRNWKCVRPSVLPRGKKKELCVFLLKKKKKIKPIWTEWRDTFAQNSTEATKVLCLLVTCGFRLLRGNVVEKNWFLLGLWRTLSCPVGFWPLEVHKSLQLWHNFKDIFWLMRDCVHKWSFWSPTHPWNIPDLQSRSDILDY